MSQVSEIIFEWTPETSGRVASIQIQSRIVGFPEWTEQAAAFDPSIGAFKFTSNAPATDTEVRARYRNTDGIYGAWFTGHIVTAPAVVEYDTVSGAPKNVENGATKGTPEGTKVAGRPVEEVIKDIDDSLNNQKDETGKIISAIEHQKAQQAARDEAKAARDEAAKVRSDLSTELAGVKVDVDAAKIEVANVKSDQAAENARLDGEVNAVKSEAASARADVRQAIADTATVATNLTAEVERSKTVEGTINQKIVNVDQKTDNNAIAIRDEVTARADADAALASRQTTIETSFKNVPTTFAVIARGYDDPSSEGVREAGLYDATGVRLHGANRAWNVVTFNADNSVKEYRSYDTWASDNNSRAMAEYLSSLARGTTVVCYTFDEPQNNRKSYGLEPALIDCGAGPAYLSNNFAYRSAYVLIGRKGVGANGGTEAYGSSWVERRFELLKGAPNLTDTRALADASARITAEETARASADEAVGRRATALESRATTLEGQTGGLKSADIVARVSEEETTRARADGALSGRVSTVEANYQNADQVDSRATVIANAKVSVEEAARTSADNALANRLTTVESTTASEVQKVDARVTEEMTTLTNANTALTNRATKFEAQMNRSEPSELGRVLNNVDARIATEETVRANADSALANRSTSLESKFNRSGDLKVSVVAADTFVPSSVGDPATLPSAGVLGSTDIYGPHVEFDGGNASLRSLVPLARRSGLTLKLRARLWQTMGPPTAAIWYCEYLDAQYRTVAPAIIGSWRTITDQSFVHISEEYVAPFVEGAVWIRFSVLLNRQPSDPGANYVAGAVTRVLEASIEDVTAIKVADIATNARITAEETTRADAISALANRSTALEASFGGLSKVVANDYFDNGIEGWTFDLNAIVVPSSGNRRNVIRTKPGTRYDGIMGRRIAITSDNQRWKLKASWRCTAGKSTYYFGMVFFDANDAHVSARDGTGNYPLGGNVVLDSAIHSWVDREAVIGKGIDRNSDYGGYLNIPAAAVYMRPVIFINYTSDPASVSEIDYFAVEEVTASEASNARIGLEETARANADGAITTRIDTIVNTYADTFADVRAVIGREEAARTSADSALASRNSTLEAQVTGTMPSGLQTMIKDNRKNLADVAWWKFGAGIPWAKNGGRVDMIYTLPSSSWPTIMGPGGSADDVWLCRADSRGNEGGGWNGGQMARLDPDRTYRFTVPIITLDDARRVSYWGVNAVCDLNTTNHNGNPYFAVTSNLTPFKWYLFVGYVFPRNSTGNSHDGAGIWDMETGAKVSAGSNFCFNPDGRQPVHRAYQYYAADAVYQAFGRPIVELVDGSETDFQSALGAKRGVVAANARITAEETARSNADSVLATRSTTLEAQLNRTAPSELGRVVNVVDARIATEESVRANADTALAQRSTTLEATVFNGPNQNSTLSSRITNEETARTNADSALATRATSLEAIVARGAYLNSNADFSIYPDSSANTYAPQFTDQNFFWRYARRVAGRIGKYAMLLEWRPADNGGAHQAYIGGGGLNGVAAGDYTLDFDGQLNAGGWSGVSVAVLWINSQGTTVKTESFNLAIEKDIAGVTGDNPYGIVGGRRWNFPCRAPADVSNARIVVVYGNGRTTGQSFTIDLLGLRHIADSNTRSRIITEETVRANADSALAGRASTLEAQFRGDTDSPIFVRLRGEETARANADGALGSRIDSVQANYVSKSDLVANNMDFDFDATIPANQAWAPGYWGGGDLDSRISKTVAWNNVSCLYFGAHNLRAEVYSRKSIPVNPALKYRMKARFGAWMNGSTGTTSRFYIGFVGLDANGAVVNHGAYGSYRYSICTGEAITDGQIVERSVIVTGEGNDSWLKFPPNTRQIRPLIFMNYDQYAINSYVDFISIEEVTEIDARVTAESTARANADGALASRATSVEARAGSLESRTGINESAIADARNKLASARLELSAVTGGGRAAITLRSDNNAGAGVDIVGDVNFSGNLNVGPDSGQRVKITNSGVSVFDGNGTMRVRLGIW